MQIIPLGESKKMWYTESKEARKGDEAMDTKRRIAIRPEWILAFVALLAAVGCAMLFFKNIEDITITLFHACQ